MHTYDFAFLFLASNYFFKLQISVPSRQDSVWVVSCRTVFMTTSKSVAEQFSWQHPKVTGYGFRNFNGVSYRWLIIFSQNHCHIIIRKEKKKEEEENQQPRTRTGWDTMSVIVHEWHISIILCPCFKLSNMVLFVENPGLLKNVYKKLFKREVKCKYWNQHIQVWFMIINNNKNNQATQTFSPLFFFFSIYAQPSKEKKTREETNQQNRRKRSSAHIHTH